MNLHDAKRTLRKHYAELPEEQDNLLGRLRPYSGLDPKHFTEILQALLALAPTLSAESRVDCETVHVIWDLCRSARKWTEGPHEPMFHGKDFISPSDKETLDRWVDEIESITLDLLRGLPVWQTFSGLAEQINHYNLVAEPQFLAPVFTEALQNQLCEEQTIIVADEEVCLCNALAAIGPPAQQCVPLLQQLKDVSPFDEVKQAAQRALDTITQ